MDKAPGSGGFRPDIEGLRAVAVVTVVLCHAGLGVVAGGFVGVDVFFVISGFLITGLVVRELERTGTLSFTRFYARRAKRLLPLAAIVLAFVALVSALMFDPVRRDLVSGDVIAAALSVVNWRFASQAIDYFAAGQDASPVRHFWSLAVEEQYYLVWPGLLLLATWWWRRAGRSLRPVIWTLLAVIGVSSFVWGLLQTSSEPDVAYFSTLTRGWELALGGALAVGATTLARMPRRVALALGWGGLAGILVAVVVYSEATPFPGTAALLPVLATGAIIAGGSVAPLRLLELRPMRYIGRISYSWYLWHWPLYVFAAAEWGTLSALQGLAVMAASLVPTIVTHHLIEDRFHHSPRLSARPRLALRLGGVCIAVAIVAGVLVSVTAPTVRTASAAEITGAREIAKPGFRLQESADALRPNPRNADADRPPIYKDGCFLEREADKSAACEYAKRGSARKAVLFGDSHAAMYFPALEAVARRHGLQLTVLVKQGCPPASVDMWNGPLGRAYVECDRWRESALRRIERERPGLVLVAGGNANAVMDGDTKLSGVDSVDPLRAGLVKTLKRLERTGAGVALMANTPWAPELVPPCVAGNTDNLRKCAFSADEGFRLTPINAQAAERVPSVRLIDPRPMVCPDDVCPAVIGDVLVYRDDNHLTATYSRSLAPWLARELAPELA